MPPRPITDSMTKRSLMMLPGPSASGSAVATDDSGTPLTSAAGAARTCVASARMCVRSVSCSAEGFLPGEVIGAHSHIRADLRLVDVCRLRPTSFLVQDHVDVCVRFRLIVVDVPDHAHVAHSGTRAREEPVRTTIDRLHLNVCRRAI